MKSAKISVIVIHFFVGIGAMAGGLAAILNPVNPLEIPDGMLEHSPFSTYLIPGIFLFVCIGIFNLLSGIIVLAKIKLNEYLPGIMGVILASWLVIQCLIIREIGTLHIIFLIIALFQGLLSVYLLYNRNMFPFNF